MKVVMFTSKLNFATAGGSVLDLHLKAESLRKLGHQVTVVTTFSHANKINQPLLYKVEEEEISAPNWFVQQWRFYFLLKKYELQTNVLYIDGNNFLYGGGFYRWLGGKIPIIAFFNIKLSCWFNSTKIKSRIRLFLEHSLGVDVVNHLDAFIFTTPMIEKLYLDFGFDKFKSHVIPDFVNTKQIVMNHQLTNEVLEEHQKSARQVIIFCSGRMIPEKGFDLIIKAFAKIKDKEKFRIIMSGNGSERDKLMSLANSFHLESFISFPGWVKKEELVDFFRSSHIFILPKWWIEYSSVLLIEAMAYGLPCIVPQGGGLEWLLGAGAYLFKEGDADSLANALEQLGQDIDCRIKLGKLNLAKAKNLDAGLLATQLEKILLSVI